jgi:hypothetical protein
LASKTAANLRVAVFDLAVRPGGRRDFFGGGVPAFVYWEGENPGFIGIGPVHREFTKLYEGRGADSRTIRAKILMRQRVDPFTAGGRA